MKTSVISILALAAAASASKYSTYYETETLTITSCAPYATKCATQETAVVHTKTKECDDEDNSYPTPTPAASYPVKQESTTKGYEASTTAKVNTVSPVYETPKKDEYTVSTIYETKVYTITSCAAYVTDCPVGHVTSTVVATTTLCPVSAYPTKPAESVYPVKPVGSVYPVKPVESVYPTKPAEAAYPSKAPVAGCPGGAYCPSTVKTVYGTAAPVTPYPPKNSTIQYTGAGNAQRAGGLLLAVGAAAVALL